MNLVCLTPPIAAANFAIDFAGDPRAPEWREGTYVWSPYVWSPGGAVREILFSLPDTRIGSQRRLPHSFGPSF